MVLFCADSKAQKDSMLRNKTYSGHFIFSVGISEPLGELSANDYSKKSSGAANTGLAIQFAFHKPFSKQAGFCVAFHRESFFLNESELNDYYQDGLLPGYVAKVDVSQNWSVSGLQAGFFGEIPLFTGKSFFIEPRIMLGVARGRSPGYTLTIDSVRPTPDPLFTITQFSTKSSNLAGTFLIGLGVNYRTKTNWCFAFHLDYVNFLAETEYDDIQLTTSTGLKTTTTWDMEMRYYTVRLGIGKLIGN